MAEFRLGRLKFNWRGDWGISTAYVIDDIVKYGSNTYVCKANHTSSANENLFYSNDLTANWSLHTEGISNKGDWVPNNWYKINDVYKYGNTQYRVTSGYTSGATFDPNNSSIVDYISSFKYEDTWSSATEYQVGDVVAYGGYTYVATSQNTNKPPAYNLTNDWDILTTGFNVTGDYSSTYDYKQGDIVLYGGYTYVAITTSTNVVPTDASSWSLVTKGLAWKGQWDPSTQYNLGDAVKKLSNSYIGVATVGNLNQDPSTDANGDYWNVLAEGAAANVMTTEGDLVYYTTGAARLPIGQDGQVLAVSPEGVPQWEANSVTHPVYYVTEEGNDHTNDGSSISRSFYSVRHACGIATGPATIYVKAGTYNETLPIVVPAEVSIVGDNLRTSKIKPAGHYDHTFISATTDCITPNTGSPKNVSAATYDSTTGDLVLTIGSHTLTTSNTIQIANRSLTFTCSQDNYATQHAYPRPEKDPAAGATLAITATTGTTITVNVGEGNAARHQVLTLASVPTATYTPTAVNYNPVSGDMVCTIGAHNLVATDSIKIVTDSLTFTCNFNGDGNTTQKTYPRASGATGTVSGYDYAYDTVLPIKEVTATTITVNVNGGQGAISYTGAYNFVTAATGAIQKASPYISYGSIITNGAGTKTASILDSSFDEKTVEIRTLTGGQWTTSDTWENGLTDVAITAVETRENSTSTMFLMSDKTMLKDLFMEGMTGFTKANIAAVRSGTISGTIVSGSDFFPDLVGTTVSGSGVTAATKVIQFIDTSTIEVDKDQTVTSTSLTFTSTPDDINNSTVKGTFVRLNPESRIRKSPYVSNCSASSSFGVGAIVDGNVHRQFKDDSNTPSNKSIVFDSFTNLHDHGVGFWVTAGGAAETVSCFTYYCHISYAATRGGRIRSLAGNSSWGNYGIVSSGFSPIEKFRSGTIEGLILEIDPATQSGSGFQIGEEIRGSSSEAIGVINSKQGADEKNLYYSVRTKGPVGVGTGFRADETITGKTSGTTANVISNGLVGNRGQSGRTLVCAGLGTSPTLEINGSIEFVTGSGDGGFNNNQITGADPFTFVISGVSQVGPTGKGKVFIDRGQLASTGAAHTGGSSTFVQYTPTGNTASFLVPAGATDTTWSVNTISGFNPGEYALMPTSNELCKIVSFPNSNSMVVQRNQDGAGTAIAHAIGESFTSIGATTILSPTSCEVWKDFVGVDTSFRAVDSDGFHGSIGKFLKIDDEFVKVTGINTESYGVTTLTLVEEKAAKCFDEQEIRIRYIFSQARLTGHDFLQVGTGGTSTTNWPGTPTYDPIQSQEITESFPGRVFYVSTDQDGNFRVGRYFRVNQATGAATLNANSFDLSGLTSLQLGSIGAQLGAQINEFSTDATLSQNSNEKVPTQAAVKSYVDTKDAERDAATLLAAQNAANLGISTALSHANAGISTLNTNTTNALALNRADSQSRSFFVGLS